MKNKKEKQISIKLVGKMKNRTRQAFKSQNIKKSNKIFNLIGCSHILKKWIIHQLYGNVSI